VRRDGFEDFVLDGWMIERPERGKRFPSRHLLGGSLCPAGASSPNAVAEGHHRGVLTPMPGTGRTHDLVLWRRQEPLLGDFLQSPLVVVVRPRLHVDQAAAEQSVSGAVTLIEKDRPDNGLEGVGEDRLERASPRLVRALTQQEVITEAEPGRQPSQALGVDDGGPQPGQFPLVGRLIGMEEMLRRDQLEDCVAEILQPLVIRRAALRMLVVVRAMGERLPKEGDVVKTNTKRPLQFL
jgi:hypothetical protein